MAKQKKNYAQLLSEREQRKKKALEEAIALFRANVGDMSGDGTWDAAENFAWEIFEEIARGEMGGFKDLMLGWGACDKFSIAMLCKLAETYLYNNDKSMPQRMPLSLRAFVVFRLRDPTLVPKFVDGQVVGFVTARAKRGQSRHHNFIRDNAIINIVRHIKEKYGYDAVRGEDKRTGDGAPSAASIVAEASQIVGISTGKSGKRGRKSGVDESTVSNLWSKRDRRSTKGLSRLRKTCSTTSLGRHNFNYALNTVMTGLERSRISFHTIFVERKSPPCTTRNLSPAARA